MALSTRELVIIGQFDAAEISKSGGEPLRKLEELPTPYKRIIDSYSQSGFAESEDRDPG